MPPHYRANPVALRISATNQWNRQDLRWSCRSRLGNGNTPSRYTARATRSASAGWSIVAPRLCLGGYTNRHDQKHVGLLWLFSSHPPARKGSRSQWLGGNPIPVGLTRPSPSVIHCYSTTNMRARNVVHFDICSQFDRFCVAGNVIAIFGIAAIILGEFAKRIVR